MRRITDASQPETAPDAETHETVLGLKEKLFLLGVLLWFGVPMLGALHATTQMFAGELHNAKELGAPMLVYHGTTFYWPWEFLYWTFTLRGHGWLIFGFWALVTL